MRRYCIPAADLQAVQEAIQTLVTTLAPHLIGLSLEDRRVLPKMGDKSLAFVRKAREYHDSAENHYVSGGASLIRKYQCKGGVAEKRQRALPSIQRELTKR